MSKQLDTKAFDDFKWALAGVTEAFRRMQLILVQFSSDLLTFGQQLHSLIWATYLAAGAPYGETDAGMMEWLKSLRDEKAQD